MSSPSLYVTAKTGTDHDLSLSMIDERIGWLLRLRG
jgi:hypothetical protein